MDLIHIETQLFEEMKSIKNVEYEGKYKRLDFFFLLLIFFEIKRGRREGREKSSMK